MKNTGIAIILSLLFSACHHPGKPIVNKTFTDSLIIHYTPSLLASTIENDLGFWKKRMDSLPDNFVNGPKYASALLGRFRLYGDIHDLICADSLYQRCDQANFGKEPGILRTLSGLSLLRHDFQLASRLYEKAVQIEGRNTVPNLFLEFDIAFETGGIGHAKKLLHSLEKFNSYGFLFRKSKLEHSDGSFNTAIACMEKAAGKAAGSVYLRQAALSNAADLYLHNGELSQAYDLYTESLRIDAADLHSLAGIGWIALVHDKNDSLAKSIFDFIRQHSHSPDILLKLAQTAESRHDTLAEKKYAGEFAVLTDMTVYGRMYSKYLVELYTGILNDPARALVLSRGEIENRPTTQVYAWYAWSLLNNGRASEAYNIFKQHISGKPLEGLELFYMGKLMLAMGKKYDAQQFFKAACKNRFDLGPAKQDELNNL